MNKPLASVADQTTHDGSRVSENALASSSTQGLDRAQCLVLCSALLRYPQAETIALVSEVKPALLGLELPEARGAEQLVPALLSLLDRYENRDLLDLQEEWLSCFELGRAKSLHLFEHIHGESRDRGQALVDLRQFYESKGLYLEQGELPDYVPVIMEFCSILTLAESEEFVVDFAPILYTLLLRLQDQQQPWAVLVQWFLELSCPGYEASVDAPRATQPSENGTPPSGHAKPLAADEDYEEQAAFGWNAKVARSLVAMGPGLVAPKAGLEGLPPNHPLKREIPKILPLTRSTP